MDSDRSGGASCPSDSPTGGTGGEHAPGLTQSLLMTLSRRVRQVEESAERMGGALAEL
jgi:hypothetical protein